MIKTKLYFIHIPKTAGTTFRWIFYNRLTNTELFIFHPFMGEHDIESAQNMGIEQFAKTKVLAGPFGFGFHNHFPPHFFSYFTFLREPVSRFISEYYYILREKKHPLYKKFVSENTTIEEFLDICIKNNDFNSQMKMIAGGNGPSSEKEQFQRALNNIERFFPIIGITELFNESLFLLSHYYSANWKKFRYVSLNVNKNGTDKITVSPETKHKDKDFNKHAIE